MRKKFEEEEKIRKLENRMVEKTAEEQNKVKRMKWTDNRLRYLRDNIKHKSIQIIGAQEEED